MAASLFWLSAFPARAQPFQWCPPAGLLIKARNTQGEYTRATKGADPNDNSVCIGVANGPGAGIDSGKTVRAIYGWYTLQNFAMTADTEKSARAGLGAILSGHSDEVSFQMTNSRPGTSYIWSGTESWKRTGQATLSIGGRPTNVMTLHEMFKGGANTNYDVYWDLWYDPVLHLFVRGESHFTGGPIRSFFEVLSVSPS
jgi:hypothetical protein